MSSIENDKSEIWSYKNWKIYDISPNNKLKYDNWEKLTMEVNFVSKDLKCQRWFYEKKSLSPEWN